MTRIDIDLQVQHDDDISVVAHVRIALHSYIFSVGVFTHECLI